MELVCHKVSVSSPRLGSTKCRKRERAVADNLQVRRVVNRAGDASAAAAAVGSDAL